MYLKLILIIFFLFLPNSMAAVVDVSVTDFINFDAIGFKKEDYGRAIKISFEAFNSGSVGCNVAFRLDVNKEKYLFTAWSKKTVFQPNDRENIEFYWLPPNITGNFTAKIRYYCANEIIDLKESIIYVENYINEEPAIEIFSPRFYEKKITFYIKSNFTDDFVIIPFDYPKDWIITQKKINIKANKIKYIELDYSKDLWKEGNIKFAIVGKKGEYGIKDFKIKKESNLSEIFFQVTNSVNRLLFR